MTPFLKMGLTDAKAMVQYLCHNGNRVSAQHTASRPATETNPLLFDAVQETKLIEENVNAEVMPLQHAESLSFFDLPGEVRNQIYKLYLKDLGWGRRRAMCLAQPALTRVNRAVREETLEMFYTHDNFEICIRANVHNEEYDRRAFRHCLRGIEATVRAGRFQLLSSLSICLIYAQNNTTSESSIDQIALRARIFNAETIITQRDGTGSFEVSPRSAFLAMDSVHNDFTQWNFLEDVEDAIAIHKQRLQKSYLEEDGDYDVYESLEEMPTDRLCKILQLLLGEPSMPEHFTRSITFDVPTNRIIRA